MTHRQLTTIAAAGSALLLISAFGFQIIGYAPCKMCLWQRWPHAAAIVIGVLAWVIPSRLWAWLGALATLTTAYIGGYHTGVENGWWEGPNDCTGGGSLGTDLLSTNITPVVMCDEIAWSLFGFSMASYNMFGALILTAIWVKAARSR
jgi:disulfide bond formation protein DsbB